MFPSRYDRRAFARLALGVCAAVLAVQCGEYFLRDVADVEAVGHKPTLVNEFGAGVPVSQSFTVSRDRLHSITISIVSDQPAVLGFELSLIRKGIRPDWPDEPITKRPVQLSVPAGVTTRTIDFDPVSRSQERVFVATFTITDLMRRGTTAADPHVALSAWADDAYRGGSLKVGTQDRWGDLEFSVQTDPPRRLSRLRDALNDTLAPHLHLGTFAFVTLGVLYTIVLVLACWAAAAAWSRLGNTSDPDTASVEASHARAGWIRSAATVLLTIGTPLLFIAILVQRERVSIDLLDELDTARLESPAGMHVGFSRIEEVINGFSPPTLFAHPPSRATWTVNVPSTRPVFKTFVAMRTYAWEQPTNGVQFDVAVTDGVHEATASRFLSPRFRFNDRAWIEMDLDLSQFAGRSAQISLVTSPGPRGDVAFDWALWGNPRIVSLRSIDFYGRANRVLNRDRNGD